MEMKLEIAKIKQIPKEISNDFGVCIYGGANDYLKEWMDFHGFVQQNVGPYTNIIVGKNLKNVFSFNHPKFEYMDGFSPNLNKYLHIGHASNLVIAKSFLSMGIAKKTIAILGDTMNGDVSNEDALNKYTSYCSNFLYHIDEIFMASNMQCDESLLSDGEEKYTGTKVFDIGGKKEVGKKSDGSTTYFYQDVALAQQLNSPTLYLTGSEQNEHFAKLQKMFPNIQHIGLGLVKTKGNKMSSRFGNVIMFEDLLNILEDNFKNKELCYNVLAGFILKSSPKSDKNLDLSMLTNPLNSPGLYLSYTLAKLKSAGAMPEDIKEFNSLHLQFKEMKALETLQPNLLFDELVEHAKKINVLYVTHKIKGNEHNKIMFSIMASDLLLGIKKLGMFDVEKV